ncbi:MAG: tRNA uridine(34) 5-carboxymethylaminomethyl modification radical SAM/GNAT enzyme Elp3 [archaeon]
MDIYEELVKELIRKKIKTPKEAMKIRQKLCRKYKPKVLPSFIQTLLRANKEELPKLSFLVTKPMRTASGVAPVAIMTTPAKCPHGKCTICPGGVKSSFGTVPQSYTGEEPAARRAARNNYDPYLQIFNRLEQYTLLNQSAQKIELIIMGGTFPARTKKYQEEFVAYSLKAMNDFGKFKDIDKFRKHFLLPADVNDQKRFEKVQKNTLKLKGKADLLKEQKRNETAMNRCVAMCVETRPDYGKLKHGNEMLHLGCTRVELGVQSVYDDVLKRINRGHTTQDTKESIRILKDLGFKVAGHYMPGLPGVSKQRDIEGMKLLFDDPDYRLDMLKIYPCMVTRGTQLYEGYKSKKFKPITVKDAVEIVVEFKKFVPAYCRIQRIQRDIPVQQISGGIKMTNLRQFIHDNYNPVCRCIRCREPRKKKISWKSVEFKNLVYEASKGKEFFISAEDVKNDIIIGFVRMRFPSQCLRSEITSSTALIRELHVYGPSVPLGGKGDIQHRGIGKQLLHKAEKIAKDNGKNKIVIISGIGVRSYYLNLGYKRDGPYMSKKIC